MNIFINILVTIACLIFGYIFGSIPTSVIIGKIKFHQDPRDFGSGNAGATNAGRLWGKKWATIITILDGMKIFIPFLICFIVIQYAPMYNGKPLIPTSEILFCGDISDFPIKWPVYWASAVGTILGHCYPIFAQFRGGKGAASFFSIACWTSWLFGFIGYILLIVFRRKTKYVSLSVLLAGAIQVILSWIFSILYMTHVIPVELFWIPTYWKFFCIPIYYSIFMTICYLIVLFQHRENIKRLATGTERKIQSN